MYKPLRTITLTAVALCFPAQNSHLLAQDNQARKIDSNVEAASSISFGSLSKFSAAVRQEPETASPQPYSAASPLSRLFVNNVCTDAGGNTCETITSGRIATANTYTGSNVYVFVWEIGYGSGEIATQGGATIANTYLIGKVGVCSSGTGYTINCPVGSTLVGWRYEWNAGYYLNLNCALNFTAQDTSTVQPWNTMSTGL